MELVKVELSDLHAGDFVNIDGVPVECRVIGSYNGRPIIEASWCIDLSEVKNPTGYRTIKEGNNVQ